MAPFRGAVPDPGELFREVSSYDPVERLELVDSALQEMISANEPSLRLMLAHSLQRSTNVDAERELPAHQPP